MIGGYYKVMASIKARQVGLEVVETIRKGRKVELGKIIRKNGYSKSISESPTKVTKTKTYIEVVYPFIEKMTAIQAKALDNLANRDLKNEKLDSVVNLSRQMLHDRRLMEEKSTENVATNIVMYGETDLMAKQVKKE